MSDLATLRIVVDATGAYRAVDQFGREVEKSAKKTAELEKAAKRVGTALGVGLTGALALVAKETADSQREQAALAVALRATGQSAGQTLEALNAHATVLRGVTAATGGQIADVQARLLSYTGIVGDAFPRATEAVLDYAQAFGVDVVAAAEAVGKALNYPSRGMEALSKQGFILTEQQKAQIAAFERTNDLAAAQAIIFGELESVTQGAAAAYRDTLGGALAAVREGFLELFDASGVGMADLIEDINLLADTLATIPTRLEIIKESIKAIPLSFDSFFAPLLGLLPGVDGANLERKYADNQAYLASLRTLLGEQEDAVVTNAVRRAQGRGRGATGGIGGGGGAGAVDLTAPAEYDKAVASVLDAFYRDAAAAFAFQQERAAALRDADAAVRSDLYTGEFAEQIGEGEREVLTFGAAVAALPDDVDRLTESARVLTEQTQLLLADFASDFLKGGVRSLEGFFGRFADLGRDAIGQVFAKEVMDRLGSTFSETVAAKFRETFGGGLAGTVGGGLFVGLLGGFLSALTDGAGQVARAMAEASRSIDDFAARALLGGLSPEERQARALLEERDAIARRAANSAGYRGGDGTLEGIRAAVQARVDTLDPFGIGGPLTDRLRELLDQLADLEDAYAANVEAVKEQVDAERALVRERQASTLQAFADSLNLSGASPLSPSQQLTEARRQYDAILALAEGGDQSAIDSLPATARTLLDASRAMFASSTRYAEEFARVQADVAGVVARLTAGGIGGAIGGGSGGTSGDGSDGSGDFAAPDPIVMSLDDLRGTLADVVGRLSDRLYGRLGGLGDIFTAEGAATRQAVRDSESETVATSAGGFATLGETLQQRLDFLGGVFTWESERTRATITAAAMPATETFEPYQGELLTLQSSLLTEQQAQLGVLQDGFAGVVQQLHAVRRELEQTNYALRTGIPVTGGVVYAPSGGYQY